MFPWFVTLHSKNGRQVFPAALSLLFALLRIVNLAQPYGLQYDRLDGLIKVQLPWGETATHGEGHISPWFYIASIGVIVSLIYALYAFGGLYYRNRRYMDFWMAFAVGLFFLGAIEAILARSGVINFIEVGPFSVIAMVLVMGVALTYKTHDQLLSSEQNFRSLFENSPISMIAIDPYTDRILQANHVALEMTGYSAAEIVSMTAAALTHPEDKSASRECYEQLCAGQASQVYFENRYMRKHGSIFHGYSSISALKDDKGRITRFIGSIIDITERKKIEASLQESETRFRAVIEQSPLGISLSKDGITVDGNAVFVKMFGYEDIAEVLGTPVTNRIAPECRADIEERIKRRIRGEVGQSTYETIGLSKDGSRFPLLVSASRIMLSEGPLSCAFLIDISDRKKFEAELRIAATAFEAQESLLITDADGVILRVNRAFTDNTGYAADEVVGQTPRILKSGRHDSAFYRAMWETLNRTGAWQGEIWDRRKNGEIYPKWLSISAVKGNDGAVTHYVGSHIDITERKAAEEKIQHLAFSDHLTNLPNRLLLLDRLKQALAANARSGRQGALLFIDLDNFKNLNDTLGHDIGDLLLQQVARLLLSCIREGDTVARLGGDEFVVMLLDLSEQPIEAAAQTKAVGEKILAALCQPYQLGKHACRSTCSLGVTLFGGAQLTIEELMKQADIAMYQAKKSGRNTLRFFDRKMQESISVRVSLENELHNAIEQQQFQLHYQSQVDTSHRPFGAEALLRWNHPERGMVSPTDFISLAEETGLILPIGKWVLETACSQLREWQNAALTCEMTLSVNVSAKQFRETDFAAQVQAAIERHAINPARLKLELTESLLQENIAETIETMNTLNKIGVQFSLDDFGTGYSSLQYLKQLPLDQIKIDQSFVRDIATDSNDKTIIRTIIAMAQSMDMAVIAEGVETEEQKQFLLNNGCTNYQGYLFSRPVPIEQFEASLKQG
jgi:diguanylate cyclase (GGDEF)-like protein/PAS domain S-box-containing protein